MVLAIFHLSLVGQASACQSERSSDSAPCHAERANPVIQLCTSPSASASPPWIDLAACQPPPPTTPVPESGIPPPAAHSVPRSSSRRAAGARGSPPPFLDRKSTRLNSSHLGIS